MLGGSNEITVVSMIHQIGLISSQSYARNNYFIQGNDFLTNTISAIGKIGIYGYKGNLSNIAIVNDILGDKKDYSVDKANPANIDSVFSVNGTHSSAQLSSVAWYWTIIANKVLTTDQINQVIAYYNLDKYVKPDIYYNVKKQGLTNDTPDEDWYLKDFSGNGRDMTLYNYARTPESGINEEGGLQSDGVVDYGQFVGDLGLKDYTVVIDRAYNNLINNQVPLISSNIVEDQTPFIVEHWNTGSNAISFSYGASRTTDIPLDINKKIVYQSTYSYMGYVIPKGNAISTGNGITLGKFGNGVQYSAICLWSLMLFPYSMSEFLIERQLKKHKLGTLYPDMVEFRPVINSNVLLDSKPTFVIRGTSTYLNAGDYVPENSQIWVSIKMNNIADRITKFTVNGKTIDIPKNAYSEVTLQYGFPFVIDKSPQKITMTIEQDENYVQWNPVVESTAEYSGIGYLNYSHNLATINVGDYISIGDIVAIRVILDNTVDEIVNCKVNGQECEIVNVSPRVFDCKFTLTSESPQNINITIDEYIRYEDIVQPYPVLLRFNDENGNEVSWGGKFKVGSTITRIGGIDDTESNLLNGLYSISGLSLNGKAVTSSTSIVEKQMVFKTTATYLLVLLFVLIRINLSSAKSRERSPQVSIMSIKRLVMLSMVLLVYLMSLLQQVLLVEMPMVVYRAGLLKLLVLLLHNITNQLKNKLCYLLIKLYWEEQTLY